MLPPVDSTVLAANPQFNALYSHITSNLLNADGSTKRNGKSADSKQKDELRKLQTIYYERKFLRSSLGILGGIEGVADLFDEELLASTLVVGQLLNTKTQLNADDLKLLQPDQDLFLDNVDQIGKVLSSYFEETALSLAKILHPTTSSTGLSDKVLTLPTDIKNLHEGISDLTQTVIAARLCCLEQLVSLFQLHREYISAMIRTLEHTIHGSISRGLESRSKYLAVVAESMALKLALSKRQVLEALHDYPGAREALENYRHHLSETRKDLDKRERRAMRVLDKYKALGDGWTALREKLDDINAEIETVKADLERLEQVD